MRTNQNKRMRGRNNNRGKSQNPLTRVFESNGPDVKIRGSASHIAEKYIQLARDAQSSGDPVGAENYYQHAEHYFRVIAAAQEQYRQTQPFYQQQGGEPRGDESYDDGDDDGTESSFAPREPSYQPREQQQYSNRESQPYQQRESQPYSPREQQPYPPRDSQQHYQRPQQQQQSAPQSNGQPQGDTETDVERLPSFITGSSNQPSYQANQPQQYQGNGQNGPNGQNGHEGGHQGDRFPLHRRRRRHRGPRTDAGSQAGSGEESAPPTPNE